MPLDCCERAVRHEVLLIRMGGWETFVALPS